MESSSSNITIQKHSSREKKSAITVHIGNEHFLYPRCVRGCSVWIYGGWAGDL